MLWCVTTFFNPAGYKSLVDNYYLFSKSLLKQKAKLLTIEIAYGEDKFWLENSVKLRGNSVMWQKERLINYAFEILPKECTKVAWLDCDLLFHDDDWVKKADNLLDKYDVIQLFKRMYHLPRGHDCYKKSHILSFPSIVYQKQIEKNWLNLREQKYLSFAAPGFAWAARRDSIQDVGVYDKDVAGSGDCLLADSLLDCWNLHGFRSKFTDKAKVDILSWHYKLQRKNLSTSYLPTEIFHLWHGNLRNRRYMHRHKTFLDNDFNPSKDIILKNNVYEWSSNKNKLHEEVKKYFYYRQEDSNE